MSRSRRIALVLLTVASACSSDIAGPEPPRPTVQSSTTTTAAPTTTVDAAERTTTTLPIDCPTEFCLVYRLDPTATWSDGTPITGLDWERTAAFYQRLPSPQPDDGYALLQEVDVLDRHTVLLVFSEPFGGWQRLFPRLIPPEFEEMVPGQPSSGAFTLGEWVPGDRIVVSRNGNWTLDDPVSTEPVGTVEEITFVFIPSGEEMLDRLVAGEVDVITVRPDVALAERVRGAAGIGFQLAPGQFWEHIDFHHEHPLLSQRWAREVFDLAIDRQKILDRTVRRYHPDWPALDATAWMGNSFRYRPHYVDRHDPGRAEQIMEDRGCVRGRNVYTCSDIEMSFRWATTNDDPLRVEVFESVREDLETVGIELVADFMPPSQFVSRDFLYGGPEAWQLIDFSWRVTDDPAVALDLYRCEPTDRNVNRYCSEGLEELTRAVPTATDPDARAEMIHQIDQSYLDDLALIPLYQKPIMMAWAESIGGPAPNYSVSSDLWNIAAWTGKDSITVALPAEPASLDPRVTTDSSANAVLATLMYGAFAMTPNHEPVPTLVETVDVIGG